MPGLLNRFRKTSVNDELRRLLGDQELPSFPAVVFQALQQIRSSDSTSQEIADSVSADPGLTVKLLGIVNSSAYSLRHSVRSVHHAVALLGRSDLESILITLAVRRALPGAAGRGFVPRRFWATAARRATTARALASRLDPSSESECFTAALLQDMAVPLILQRHGEEYGKLLECWHGGGSELAVLERDHFGWDHARVGMLMASEWQFPQGLTAAIAAHHGNAADPVAGLPAVNLVATLREGGDSREVERIVEQADENHGLPPDETKGILCQAFADAEGLARLFG